jgi:hypothetical protein
MYFDMGRAQAYVLAAPHVHEEIFVPVQPEARESA